MKLTDTEKREILKLIEADKPLPDKYLFMLFDYKREVELVWNGKTSEVTNIVFDFIFVDAKDFNKYKPNSFSSLVINFRKHKDDKTA
ncbi:MAG: hypothetical protein U0586_16130 [Candidatus Brocadiaceae bacterium]